MIDRVAYVRAVAFVRVQLSRRFRFAPVIGKWNIYSSAYFETNGSSPDSTVRDQITRMFMGQASNIQNGGGGTGQVVSGAGAGQLTAWTWSGTDLVPFGSWSVTIHPNETVPYQAGISLPSQAAIAVGYRATVAGPRQRGRSRWWLGPLSGVSIDPLVGGARLTNSYTSTVATNAANSVGILAGLGWQLVVRSGTPATPPVTFSDAVEVYVDDVIDVMRSRRTWQINQARINL